MDLGEVKGAFRGSIPTTLEAAILRTTASCGTHSTSQGIYSDKKGVGCGGAALRWFPLTTLGAVLFTAKRESRER
jgi:hypothetical protein